MSTKEMESKIRNLRELKRMAEELADEITAAEDEIKAEMTARGAVEIIAGEYKVRWAFCTSSRFDTKRFQKERPKLYAAYLREIDSRRFTVA